MACTKKIGVSILVVSLKRFYGIQKGRVKQKTMELIELNKSLKQTSDKKDKIITIISHDLKNPLQSIIQTLELINSGDLSEEDIKYLRKELSNDGEYIGMVFIRIEK